MADMSVGEPDEHRRVVDLWAVGLLAMRVVVEPGAQHLARIENRGQDLDIFDAVVRIASGRQRRDLIHRSSLQKGLHRGRRARQPCAVDDAAPASDSIRRQALMAVAHEAHTHLLLGQKELRHDLGEALGHVVGQRDAGALDLDPFGVREIREQSVLIGVGGPIVLPAHE